MDRDYVIITDSTVDLTQEIINELGVEIVLMTYTINGETLKDTTDPSEVRRFYDRLRAGDMSTTSQINSETFRERFEEIIKEGKDILYLGFSSGISGTFQSSCIAKQDITEAYPDSIVEVVDTKCASMGQGLIVYYAAKMKQSGKSLYEVRDWVVANKQKMNHFFTVDDLSFLKRGGRVSSTAAMLGGLLNIKPVLDCDKDGKLRPLMKVRGRKKALDELVHQMELLVEDPEGQMIFISHGDCEDDARYVEREVRARFDIADVKLNFIGSTIGSHSGPGTIALFFLGKERT